MYPAIIWLKKFGYQTYSSTNWFTNLTTWKWQSDSNCISTFLICPPSQDVFFIKNHLLDHLAGCFLELHPLPPAECDLCLLQMLLNSLLILQELYTFDACKFLLSSHLVFNLVQIYLYLGALLWNKLSTFSQNETFSWFHQVPH